MSEKEKTIGWVLGEILDGAIRFCTGLLALYIFHWLGWAPWN